MNLCHLCGGQANHGVYPRKPDAYGGTTSDTDGPITWWCWPCSKAEASASAWAVLEPFHQALIRARFPDLGDPVDWSVKKEPRKLLTLAKAGSAQVDSTLLLTCGRCGGTGRHSYNQLDGDRCYGCSGTGKRYAPERTKAQQAQWIAAAQARVEQIRAAKALQETGCRPCA